MPDFVIVPAADYDVDPEDFSNAIFSFDEASPLTLTGLSNGTAYRTYEVILSPVSAEFTPAAAATSISVTRLPSASVASVTTTPDFGTFDLSAYAAGDLLVLVYGPTSALEGSFTVAGNAVPAAIADTGSDNSGGRIWVYEYTLLGTEGASATITATGATNANAHILEAIVIEGGTRDTVNAAFVGSVTATGADGTPTGADNLIIAIAMGRTSFFGAHSWTNATQVGSVYTGASRSSSVALVEDVAVAARTITFTPDAGGGGSDEAGLAVLAYSA